MKLYLGREARARDKKLGFIHIKVIVEMTRVNKIFKEERCSETETRAKNQHSTKKRSQVYQPSIPSIPERTW